MSQVLKPISPGEYEFFYKELYSDIGDGVVLSRFRVGLDTDPTQNPKSINEKLAAIQNFKDRLVVILNRAVKNELYWKTICKKLDDRFESEVKKAYLLPDVKKGGNTETRVSLATDIAKQALLAQAFKGEGTYDSRMSEIRKYHAESIAFLSEVKNLYDNLDSSNMSLAVQLKSVLANARIYGDGWVDGGMNGGRPDKNS